MWLWPPTKNAGAAVAANEKYRGGCDRQRRMPDTCGGDPSCIRHCLVYRCVYPASLAGVPDALIFFCFLFFHQGKKRKTIKEREEEPSKKGREIPEKHPRHVPSASLLPLSNTPKASADPLRPLSSATQFPSDPSPPLSNTPKVPAETLPPLSSSPVVQAETLPPL